MCVAIRDQIVISLNKRLRVQLAIMLDVSDFIEEKGGDPKRIRESQRRRYAPEEVVDEVIALYEDHRKSKYGRMTLYRLALTRRKM